MSAQAWSAILTAVAIFLNLIWIVLGLRIKNEILERLDRFSERADTKYAAEKICEQRYSELSDRMTRAGA